MKPAPGERPHILVVDDDASVRDVIQVILTEEGYLASASDSAENALEFLGANEPDLVISDVKLPGKDGMWLLSQLQKDKPSTAVIMLTGYGDTESAVECLRRGAVDYLLKPPRITSLIRSIERALARRRIEIARRRYQKKLEKRVQDKTEELSQALLTIKGAYSSTLAALVAALDAREHETSDHSQRVVHSTMAIARAMGVPEEQLEEIGRGALLHDVGKIGTPDSILLKPGPLTTEEWVEMRKHPQTGYQILQSIPFLGGAAEIVLSHQERFDGSGYPRKLKGSAIPLGARIFTVADTVDAMTSNRPYRHNQGFARAQEEIVRCRATQFDPDVVDVFLSLPKEKLRLQNAG